MRKQIKSISPLQTAKVMAVLYFVISLPFVLFMFISMSMIPGPRFPMSGMMLLMPVMYLVFGFIFTLVGAWVYNLVAGWIGGIEFTTTEIDNS
ncbi:MAG: hypothetical protein V4447_06375 [Pseudomonadota bacterium]